MKVLLIAKEREEVNRGAETVKVQLRSTLVSFIWFFFIYDMKYQSLCCSILSCFRLHRVTILGSLSSKVSFSEFP